MFTVVLNFDDVAGRSIELPCLPVVGQQYFIGTSNDCDVFQVATVDWLNDLPVVHLSCVSECSDDLAVQAAFIRDMFSRRGWPIAAYELIEDELTDLKWAGV